MNNVLSNPQILYNPAINSQKVDLSIAELEPGKQAVVRSLGNLPPAQREILQAYGILPGRLIQVIQHRPVTVILFEHTELAFEKQVASQVFVSRS